MGWRRGAVVVEETVAGPVGGAGATARLTLRLEAPGDPCAPLSVALPFEFGAAVPEAALEALDRGIYDAVYRAVAELPGGLPPEGLKVAVTALAVEPPPGTARTGPDDRLPAALGAALGPLVGAAFARGRRRLPE